MSESTQQETPTRARLSAVPTGYLHTPHPSPTETILDRAALLARVGDDLELLRELAGIFVEDCPRCLEDILSGIKCGDARQVRLQAHLLGGTASNFGAHALTTAARRIELMGKADDLTNVADAYEELIIAADELMPALRELTVSDTSEPAT